MPYPKTRGMPRPTYTQYTLSYSKVGTHFLCIVPRPESGSEWISHHTAQYVVPADYYLKVQCLGTHTLHAIIFYHNAHYKCTNPLFTSRNHLSHTYTYITVHNTTHMYTYSTYTHIHIHCTHPLLHSPTTCPVSIHGCVDTTVILLSPTSPILTRERGGGSLWKVWLCGWMVPEG